MLRSLRTNAVKLCCCLRVGHFAMGVETGASLRVSSSPPRPSPDLAHLLPDSSGNRLTLGTAGMHPNASSHLNTQLCSGRLLPTPQQTGPRPTRWKLSWDHYGMNPLSGGRRRSCLTMAGRSARLISDHSQ